ncbi:MAG: polysaccharide deacetylase family protein, partial [Ruminiclostridium sp.]|nr:polysaccharide deacetylase family protein [Ruminiclostridium sp.]
PPEGTFSENTLKFCKELGYTPVFWSYAYADWDNNAQMSEEKALDKLLSNLHPGEVLLLHPTSATNAAILDRFLTEAEKQGYRFGSLTELAVTPSFDITDYRKQGLVFSENPSAGKYLALTFDDGPHATQTARILSVLQKHGVKATFFPIGENVKAHPELVKMASLQGHEIGNHTYSHCKVSSLSEEALQGEILETEFLLQDLCGVTPTVFRPPGGDISKEAVELVNRLGYRYVLWSWRVDTRDWASVSVDSVVNTVLRGVRDGNIILFHDYVAGTSPTAEALEILIPRLKEMGYEFVTVSDLADL